ncbi:MAG: phosphotransferase [Lachnospiraceae bacterium]|nr:phosphotransferase [Lachnospiraceae bacterium]
MEKTSLKNWQLFSERHNSRNYMSLDHKWLLKTSSDKVTIPLSSLEEEYELNKDILALGVATPKIKGIVEIEEGGLGIIYEYIDGKKSYSRAIGEDESRLDSLMKSFATMGKELHSIPCDTNKFPNIEDKMYTYIDMSKHFTDKEKNVMRDFISKVEKKTTCLHGDFQISNAITSPSRDYFIDLGMLSYGNELYDIGFWYLFSNFNHKGIMAEHFFHMPEERIKKCFDTFLRYYYNIKDDKEIEDKKEMLKPYAMIGIFPFCINDDRDDYLLAIKEHFFNDAFSKYL